MMALRIYLPARDASMIKIFRSRFWLFFLGIGFFFAVNHYFGFRIDGILYLLQVIHRWHPERFIGDAAFMFGNQDSFTIFSPIYGVFIKLFSVDPGAKIACLVMQGLWCVSFLYMVRKYAAKFHCSLVALPFALTFFALFSNGGINAEFPVGKVGFWLIEPCVVSRLLAEGVAIAGLALLFDHNKYKALGLFLLGTLIHPLLAGWCLPLWLFFHYPKTKIPIVIAAALFPLTILLHKGSFDAYPADWLPRPLEFFVSLRCASRYIAYLLAFFAVWKFSHNGKMRKLAAVSLLLLVIAVYLYITSVFTEHIFLYQVQPFRIEWLCIVLSSILFAAFAWERFLLARKKKKVFTRHNLGLSLLAVALFFPEHYLPASLCCAFLFFIQERTIPESVSRLFKCLLLLLAISEFALICYTNFVLNEVALPFSIPLSSAFDWVLKIGKWEQVFALLALGFFWRQLRWPSILCFAIFFVFPEFVLFPLVAVVLWLLPPQKQSINIVVLLIAGLCGIEVSTVAHKMNLSLFICIITLAVFAAFIAAGKKENKNKRYIFVISSILACACYVAAFAGWDIRQPEQRISERQMNAFVDMVVFPQVRNRGKMLVSVSGYALATPRLQFLSGAYVDDVMNIGEVFYKGQYEMSVSHKNRMVHGADTLKYERMPQYEVWIKSQENNSEILLSRTKYLCGIGDIEYWMTDVRFDASRIADSAYLGDLRTKVYLYSCLENRK